MTEDTLTTVTQITNLRNVPDFRCDDSALPLCPMDIISNLRSLVNQAIAATETPFARAEYVEPFQNQVSNSHLCDVCLCSVSLSLL